MARDKGNGVDDGAAFDVQLRCSAANCQLQAEFASLRSGHIKSHEGWAETNARLVAMDEHHRAQFQVLTDELSRIYDLLKRLVP